MVGETADMDAATPAGRSTVSIMLPPETPARRRRDLNEKQTARLVRFNGRGCPASLRQRSTRAGRGADGVRAYGPARYHSGGSGAEGARHLRTGRRPSDSAGRLGHPEHED